VLKFNLTGLNPEEKEAQRIASEEYLAAMRGQVRGIGGLNKKGEMPSLNFCEL